MATHRQLATAVLERLARVDPDGSRRAAVEADQAAELLVAALVDPSTRWVEELGAFYDVEGVSRLLGGVSRQAVSKRKGLLALTTGSGRVVYPAFQFRDRLLAPGLGEVLALLPATVVSPWTVASWLISPEADLDGSRPIDVLFEDTPAALAAVLEVTRHWAYRLAA
jgi:hypothetical protein